MIKVPRLTMNDGLTIPHIGFGVWQVADEVVADACIWGLKAGYRHIDTASIYGNERGVGEAISRSSVPREEIFLTTKVWPSDYGYDQTMRSFQGSLSLLGVSEVDLFLVHWPAPATGGYRETWRALVDLQSEGRARSIGVSNFNRNHLEAVIGDTGVVPAINQIELHPWLAQRELREFNKSLGILTEAWSPLASGTLLDEPTIAAIGEAYGKNPAQVMIRWHLQLGNVVLPKSVTPSRIKSNLDVFDFQLSDQDMITINNMDLSQRTGPDPDDFL